MTPGTPPTPKGQHVSFSLGSPALVSKKTDFGSLEAFQRTLSETSSKNSKCSTVSRTSSKRSLGDDSDGSASKKKKTDSTLSAEELRTIFEKGSLLARIEAMENMILGAVYKEPMAARLRRMELAVWEQEARGNISFKDRVWWLYFATYGE